MHITTDFRQVALPEEDLNYIARTTAINRDQVEVSLAPQHQCSIWKMLILK
jgi:hypothetical protein